MKYMKSFIFLCLFFGKKIYENREPILSPFTDPQHTTTKICSSAEIFRGQSSILANAMVHEQTTIFLDSSLQASKAAKLAPRRSPSPQE